MSTNGVEVGQRWRRAKGERVHVVDMLGGSQARVRDVETKKARWVRYAAFGTLWVRVEVSRNNRRSIATAIRYRK